MGTLTIEIEDDARYVLVTCRPQETPTPEARVIFPAERGMATDDAILLIETAKNILTQRSADERQQQAAARLSTPLAPVPARAESPVIADTGQEAPPEPTIAS